MTTSIRRKLALLLFVVGMVALGLKEPRASETTVLSQRVLDNGAALNAVSTIIGASIVPRCRESAFYIDWGSGVASGGVTIESSFSDTYTGVWAPLAVVPFAATAPKQDLVQITGVHLNLRARVSTVLAGGVVDVWFVCN